MVSGSNIYQAALNKTHTLSFALLFKVALVMKEQAKAAR